MAETASIYVHIPFCFSKCAYCDFASFAGMDALMEPYVSALEKEILAAPPFGAPTAFIGGGTPSHLPLPLMEKIVAAMERRFVLGQGAEFTIEANPRSAMEEGLRSYRRWGINRISIGVQSFDDRQLRAIGRAHDAATARATFNAARAAGFGNISIDVMYGLPGQTTDGVASDLEELLRLGPEHISAYQLILEEGTRLEEMVRTGTVTMPDDEALWAMGELVADTLEKEGYRHYEVSNYAREGFECRHNMAYWLGKDFLGLGSGAHSFIDGKRLANPDEVKEYIRRIEAAGVAHEEVPATPHSYITDYMLMRLRLINNEIAYDELARTLNIEPRSYFKKPLASLERGGYLVTSDAGFRLTKKGIQFLNDVLVEFTKV